MVSIKPSLEKILSVVVDFSLVSFTLSRIQLILLQSFPVKNVLVDVPSPELASGLRVDQAYSPRPENPQNLPRPRATNIKSAGIAFVDLRSTLCSHCRKILPNYSAA